MSILTSEMNSLAQFIFCLMYRILVLFLIMLNLKKTKSKKCYQILKRAGFYVQN